MASRTVVFFATLALVLTSSVALAAAPGPAERETARRLMDEGKARLKANEPARAVEAFQKAHEIMHVPTTGIALARAYLAAGQLVEARDAALEVGRLPHEEGEAAVFDQARRSAKELEAQLKPRIPTVRVKVKGAAATRIAIDDVEVPPALVGEPIAMNPGKRVVSARNAEGGETKAEIELAEHETKDLELTLPEGGAVATKRGEPRRRDDGRPTERTPLANGLVYGGFVVAGVGLAGGLVTGAMTLSKASDVEPRCERGICAPEAKSDLDSANLFANISTAAIVVGAVGLAAGVVGLLLPRRTMESHSALVIGPGLIRGTF